MNQFGALITPTKRRGERLKFAYLIIKNKNKTKTVGVIVCTPHPSVPNFVQLAAAVVLSKT